ncbi:MAG: hypothetical protein SD837_09735 [Candidatus Electrothrix scaldis]|nr:MAG: hypothetical protein SD837_09735 [Candidatus Electrothrix sp. GW3-3]
MNISENEASKAIASILGFTKLQSLGAAPEKIIKMYNKARKGGVHSQKVGSLPDEHIF